MLEGLRKIADGVGETLNSVNPLVDDFKEVHEQMIGKLLDEGFNKEQITSLVDLDRGQFIDWIDLEIKVRERIAKKAS